MESKEIQEKEKSPLKKAIDIKKPDYKIHHISAIVNAPHSGIISSVSHFLTETFGSLSYNPSLTEHSVAPSTDIPFVSISELEPFYQKIARGCKVMESNHLNGGMEIKKIAHQKQECADAKFYELIPKEFFADRFVVGEKYLTVSKSKQLGESDDINNMHDYLEIVDNALIKIIKDKHEEIQHAFISLENLHDDVAVFMSQIEIMKGTSKILREQMKKHFIRMYNLKRVQAKNNRRIEVLKALSVGVKAIKRIQQSDSSLAAQIGLYKSSLSAIEPICKHVRPAHALYNSLSKIRSGIQEQLQNELEVRITDALNSIICFKKATINEDVQSFTIELFEDFKEIVIKAFQTLSGNWTLNVSEDGEISRKLADIVVNYSKIQDVSNLYANLEGVVSQYFNQIFNQAVLFIKSMSTAPKTPHSLLEINRPLDMAYLIILLYYACYSSFSLMREVMDLSEDGSASEEKKSEIDKKSGEKKGIVSNVKGLIMSKLHLVAKALKPMHFLPQEYCEIGRMYEKLVNTLASEFDIDKEELLMAASTQHGNYLRVYAMNQLEVLQKTLDSEKWELSYVAEEYSGLIELMHNHGDMKINKEFLADKKTSKLISDEINYSPTSSLVLLTDIILQYVQLITSFPQISFDSSLNLLETIKMFNTKSRHLVLGAGAVQLNTVSKITAKHLAMCSESISFLLGELPHLKGRIEIVVPEENKKTIEDNISSLKASLISHKNDTHGKISSIISTKLKSYFGGILKSDIRQDKESIKTSIEAAEVIAELKAVSEEIEQVLPNENKSLIFQEAFNDIAIPLEQLFKTVQKMDGTRIKQIIVDITEISTTIGELKIPEQGKIIKKRMQAFVEQLTYIPQ